MHTVIISQQLKDSLKEENLGYNLGSYQYQYEKAQRVVIQKILTI
jgi:hypothetical protein